MDCEGSGTPHPQTTRARRAQRRTSPSQANQDPRPRGRCPSPCRDIALVVRGPRAGSHDGTDSDRADGAMPHAPNVETCVRHGRCADRDLARRRRGPARRDRASQMAGKGCRCRSRAGRGVAVAPVAVVVWAAVGIGAWRQYRLPRQTLTFLREKAPTHVRGTQRSHAAPSTARRPRKALDEPG